MIEAFLFINDISLMAISDAIDIYEGSIPPSATFQVVDVDNTTEVVGPAPTGDGNVN